MELRLDPPRTPAPAPRLLSGPLRPLTIGVVALASLVAFEALAVGTAMPTVARDLAGLELYALAFGGPLAAGVVSMVVSGGWSDRRGGAVPLWHGVAWFLAGLLVAGLARHMWFFVVGRVVQGFGSGLVSVALYVLVGHLFPAELRARIFAALAGAWVLPSIAGPWVAGLIVEHAGWRWVFLGVPAVAVPAALVLARGLTGAAPPAPQPPAPPAPHPPTPTAARGPLRSALGAALGVGLLYYGGQQRGLGALVPVALGAAAVAAAVPRLLPPGALRAARGLPTVVLLRGMAGAAFTGTEAFVPLLLSRERGLSPALAGLALTVSALTWCAGSWFQGRPHQPLSRTRLLRLGMALIVAGIAAAALIVVPAVPVAVGMAGWGLGGLGMGVVYPTLSVLTLDLSRPQEQGRNSSALHLCESLFAACAFTLVGFLFAALLLRSAPAAFLGSFAVTAAVALLGLAIAARTRPA